MFNPTAEITVNGQTINLAAIVGTEAQLNDAALAEWGSVALADVEIGEIAYIWARGAMRKGVVTGKGRKLIEVTYTTQTAVDLNERLGHGVTVTATKREESYVWVHRPVSVEATPDRNVKIIPVKSSMPQYRVEDGNSVIGVIFDEQLEDGTSLKRGRFAAWASITGATSFHATIEDAVPEIADSVPAPAV